MCDNMNQEYFNPWDKGFFLTGISMFIIAGFGSGLVMLIITDNIIILIISSLLALLGILALWDTNYLHRPSRVLVRFDGVDLYLRHLKTVSYGWSDLIAIYADPNVKSSIFSDFQGYGGSLVFRIKEPYDVSYRIASAINEAYRTSTGSYPVKWNGHEDYKKLRKRIMKSRTYNNY